MANKINLKNEKLEFIPQIQADNAVAPALNTVYYISGALAVLILVIAGFTFVTSAGNPDNVKRARNAMIGAAIGLVVISMAFAITQFIIRGMGS